MSTSGPVRTTCAFLAVALSACEGPAGVAGSTGAPGPTGTTGAQGADGDAGAPGPTGPRSCTVSGWQVKLSASAPANGMFFATGEQASATIQIVDGCGQPFPVAQLGTANFYLSGPRLGSQTKTASKLLNCITDRKAADRQHHFINLIKPSFADTTQSNLAQDPDGTIHFTFAAISDDAPGTYTLGVWAKSKDDVAQALETVEIQVGTATREEYASGPSAQSSCYACHLGPMSGKSYQAHIIPGFSPVGNYALDQTPIANCKLCHNLDGYSLNPIVRKVHGAHRGMNQLAPGVAHPEYGLPGADDTLAAFTDVQFPSMPGAERDCVKCHADDRWKTPSRMACGTCHDNVFFDSGTLKPPRQFGGTCAVDGDCASNGAFATCSGSTCVRAVHPVQPDDAQCAVCHTSDGTGIADVTLTHEITQRTRTRGLKLTNAALSGGSGAGGSFQIGDTPVLRFKLVDKANNVVSDLASNANLSGTVIVAGPTDDRQRIIGPLSIKSTGTLAFDAPSATYTYTFPSTIPAKALTPFNAQAPFTRSNGPGTYTLWAYVNENLTAVGQSVLDAANAVIDFDLGTTAPLVPRQVIARDACNGCHVRMQFHSGPQVAAEACSLCHTPGSFDTAVGNKGLSCTQNSDCGGFTGGWESCQTGTCVITVNPTPNQTIDFRAMIHDLHYARLRGGYSERNNLINPPDLVLMGDDNSVDDMQFALFPQDVRNCKRCHADVGGKCSASAPCGVGQSCQGGTCVNTAWLAPSARVCTSCHDEDAVFGHAALQTWIDPSGNPVETCVTCHGDGAAFSVDKVHNIAAPYVPPYAREKN